MDETWLYHYDPETKQQSMEWRYSCSPRPQKIPSAKIHWKSSRLEFFGTKTASSHWLSSKDPNYQRGVLRISTGVIKDILKEKTPREGHQGGLVLARQCPGLPGTCNPEETVLPGNQMSWSPTPYSGSGPFGIQLVPWTEKNNWKVSIFRPTRRSLLPRRPGWTDKLLNFFVFEWHANVRTTG